MFYCKWFVSGWLVVNSYAWLSGYASVVISVVTHGYQWLPMVYYAYQWLPMIYYAYQWLCMHDYLVVSA